MLLTHRNRPQPRLPFGLVPELNPGDGPTPPQPQGPAWQEPGPPSEPSPQHGPMPAGGYDPRLQGQPSFPSGYENNPNQQLPPYPVQLIPPKLPALPVTPRPYHQFWRTPGCSWWRGLLIVVLAFVAFAVLGVLVVSVATGLEIGITGQDLDQAMADLAAGKMSAVGIFANSLGIALLLPVILLLGLISGQPAGYLSSVVGRLRWGWFWQAILICSPLFLAFIAFDIWFTNYDLQLRTGSWGFLVAVLLVTPFQSAAEEYLDRGLLFRTVGSWIPGPRVAFLVAATVSSLVFMSLHVSTDLWYNLVYFAFGFAGAYLTWRTGGLEAAIALHVANNMFAMAVVPFTDWTNLFDRSAGVGSPAALVQLIPIIGSVLLLEWAAKRRGLVVATGPAAMPPAEIRLMSKTNTVATG